MLPLLSAEEMISMNSILGMLPKNWALSKPIRGNGGLSELKCDKYIGQRSGLF